MAKKPKTEPPPKAIVLIDGGSRRVVFAQTIAGRSPAREYLFSLSETDQRKFAPKFRRLSEGQMLRNPEHLRDLCRFSLEITIAGIRQKITKIIWEVKIDGHRILAFQDNLDWVLTNGSPKIRKKAFGGDIETAKNVMRDYLGR
jgi:hypothetical protein